VGIRETLNQNPGITTGATAAIILIALGFIIWQFTGGGGPSIQNAAFFSTDDGETWFEDEITKLAPFEKDGKQAYRVYVFTCDGGSTKFVSHLERYTEEAKKKIEEMRNAPEKGPPNPMMFEGVLMTGIEVKDPKSTQWVRQADFQRAQQVMMPVCPDGTKTNLEAVFPD